MRVESLDIHITDRCNLKCKYCYLQQGNAVTRPDISDEIIAVLPEVTRRLGVKKINFFGGEPLLARDRIEKIVATVGDSVRYSIVTNGVVGDDSLRDFLRAHKIGVQRSIDGCPQACALNRPDVTEKYVELTPVFADKGRPRRSTITENAAPLLYRSWLWLKKNGFGSGWTPIPDNYKAWSDESIAAFVEQMKLIARDLVEDVRAGKSPFYNYWFTRLGPAIRTPDKEQAKGCGAGQSLLALRQDGAFFACHRFVTDDILSDWCFGHVWDVLEGKPLRAGPSAHKAIETCKKNFATAEVFSECHACEAKAGCAGGCYHVNRAVNGDPAKPELTWCKLRRNLLPVVRWVDKQIGKQRPDWWRGNQTAKIKQCQCRPHPKAQSADEHVVLPPQFQCGECCGSVARKMIRET